MADCWPHPLIILLAATILPSITCLCHFNPLCSCLNSGPTNLGNVHCLQVPLSSMPRLKGTIIHELTLMDNDLRVLDENHLAGTGISSLHINHNLITSVPEGAFTGLDRSLLSLDLSNNKLHSMPQSATLRLGKLQVMNLTGNLIAEVHREDFRGLGSSLNKLLIAANSITHISQDTFSDLTSLEVLDLSNNDISYLNDLMFSHSPKRLRTILLAGNLLSKIPLEAIAPVATIGQSLTLDISHNRISSITNSQVDTKLSLHKLLLDENVIESLPSESFRNFNLLSTVSLRGNPLKVIEDNAFLGVTIHILDLSECDISEIPERAFKGLEPHLDTLDLSNNNLVHVSPDSLKDLNMLTILSLSENKLKFWDRPPSANISSNLLDGLEGTLKHLSIDRMGDSSLVPIEKIKNMTNLQSLSICHLPWGKESLTEDIFRDFGSAINHISLRRAHIKEIGPKAFRYVPGVQKLDLSDNSIETVSLEALDGIRHSLKVLRLSAAFSNKVEHLPRGFFSPTVSLADLDVSNNNLQSVPEDLLSLLTNLKHLNFQDNKISMLKNGVFHGTATTKLETLRLSFNMLTHISQRTFWQMGRIRKIYLDDNVIRSIETAAFESLPGLEYVDLEGNKLSRLDPESFLYLPKLSGINFAFNSLQELNFNAFEQVGTLSKLGIDCSHNDLSSLTNQNSSSNGGRLQANIELLNLSHNNISIIEEGYFEPVRNILMSLDISHNCLSSSSESLFLGHLPHLSHLLLDHNHLTSVNLAINCPNLRLLSISNNNLTDGHLVTVNPWPSLQWLDLSDNALKTIPAYLSHNASIEHFSISGNLLEFIPGSLIPRTVRYLDLSRNKLKFVSRDDLHDLSTLSILNLQKNSLIDMDSGSFAKISQLVELDISNNPLRKLSGSQFSMIGALRSLEYLNVANVSWGQVPLDLKTRYLLKLNLSYNGISESILSSQPLVNSNLLRELDLSGNSITLLPQSSASIWYSYPKLQTLFLQGNPIQTIDTSTFLGLSKLKHLDISLLPVNNFNSGSLIPLTILRSLSIGTYNNIAKMIESNIGLHQLSVVLSPGENILDRSHLDQRLPFHLDTIIVTGDSLKQLGQSLFREVQSRSLSVFIVGPVLEDVGQKVFDDTGRVRSLQITVGSTGLGNPMKAGEGAYPGEVSGVFLRGLQLRGNRWKCDCKLGWIEPWMRRWRQWNCNENSCGHITRSLRVPHCDGSVSSNNSVMSVLKEELECGWSVAMGQRSASREDITVARSLYIILAIIAQQYLCHSL